MLFKSIERINLEKQWNVNLLPITVSTYGLINPNKMNNTKSINVHAEASLENDLLLIRYSISRIQYQLLTIGVVVQVAIFTIIKLNQIKGMFEIEARIEKMVDVIPFILIATIVSFKVNFESQKSKLKKIIKDMLKSV